MEPHGPREKTEEEAGTEKGKENEEEEFLQ